MEIPEGLEINQTIEPLPDLLAGDIDELLAQRLNQVIERLNWLCSVMACHFIDGMCVVHGSPQIAINRATDFGIVPEYTDYCGIAYEKMKARVERRFESAKEEK